jgi:light-regulated signal transduction histidine kinase (bacteriophytochrome)
MPDTPPMVETYPESVDLSNCDREPIHIPGAVQPHGVLFAASLPGGEITHASESAGDLLGLAPDSLIGRPLRDALPQIPLGDGMAVAEAAPDGPPVLLGTADVGGREWDVVAHRRGESTLIVELTPRTAPGTEEASAFYRFVGAGFARLRSAPHLAALSSAMATEVRTLTGFDRVMVYRFHPDAHGEVIAEDRAADMEPFMGLHYPASDIPQQARALYLLNWLRLISDVGYRSAALVARPDLPPLDLTYSVLRSVSPVHIEYLKNMGVGASMSISLVENGRLWGLIACHHREARYVPYPVRAACELLAQVASAQLGATQARARSSERFRMAEARDWVSVAVEEGPTLTAALARSETDLLSFCGATGAAVSERGAVRLFGVTPDEEAVSSLIDWLAGTARDGTWATDALPEAYPPASAYADRASGVMAAAVAPETREWVLWFRPEVVRTVDWAGDPRHPYTVQPGGSPELGAKLGPRRSFDLWRETVRGRSAPWGADAPEVTDGLRRVMVAAALRRSQAEVARLNAELSRSNDELEAFTYAAAHDLKEPLRGIRHYATFLDEDHGDTLDDEARGQLTTIGRLTRRMEEMIESLFQYARVGTLDLAHEPVDLNTLVADVREGLAARLAETRAELRVPRPLPTLPCDRVRAGEVFHNLISNGLKYSDRSGADQWVEVGYQDPEPGAPLVLYVRDNGIGIPAAQQEGVFRIFRRLHTRDAYGGGAGAGLTIVRRIIERHGGRLWLESQEGEGTTFFFTLAPEGPNPRLFP